MIDQFIEFVVGQGSNFGIKATIIGISLILIVSWVEKLVKDFKENKTNDSLQ